MSQPFGSVLTTCTFRASVPVRFVASARTAASAGGPADEAAVIPGAVVIAAAHASTPSVTTCLVATRVNEVAVVERPGVAAARHDRLSRIADETVPAVRHGLRSGVGTEGVDDLARQPAATPTREAGGGGATDMRC